MIFRKIPGKHISSFKDMSLKDAIEEVVDPAFVYYPIKLDTAEYEMIKEIGDNVLMGEPILRRLGRFGHNVSSSVSGTIMGIKKMWHSSGKMVECLEIKNDMKDTLYEFPHEIDSKEGFVNLLKDGGIIGLGGAGFPTYVKYIPDQPADYLIVNAAECEPYITCDYQSIIEDASKLIRGLEIISKYIEPKHVVIAIKNNKLPAIEALKQAIGDKKIEIFLLQDKYPAGWEKYLVEKITKKTYTALPREAGAIVDNVQTIMAIADLIDLGLPLIKRVVTISGEGIVNPKNFRIRIGMPATDLIRRSGGYDESLEETLLICGGPMTGKTVFADSVVMSANVGSILVKPKLHVKANECIGCGKCSEQCPTFLTPTSIRSAVLNKDIAALNALNVMKCVQCGLCSYICPSRIEMTDYMAKGKDLVIKARSK